MSPAEMTAAEMLAELRRLANAHVHSSTARAAVFELLDELDDRIVEIDDEDDDDDDEDDDE